MLPRGSLHLSALSVDSALVPRLHRLIPHFPGGEVRGVEVVVP